MFWFLGARRWVWARVGTRKKAERVARRDPRMAAMVALAEWVVRAMGELGE